MQMLDRVTHAMRCDLDVRIGKLQISLKRLTDQDGPRAKEFRRMIALYSDLSNVARRHTPPTLKVAKLADVL